MSRSALHRVLVCYGLAVVFGPVPGAILALAQWRILRRHAPHAGLWIATLLP